MWRIARRSGLASEIGEGAADVVAHAAEHLPVRSDDVPAPTFGGGSAFSGGGGGAAFGGDVPVVAPVRPLAASYDVAPSPGGTGLLDLDLDLDDGWVVVILIVVLGAVLVAAGLVLWSAPALLAELLLDGLVAAGVYRRLHRGERQHWLAGAVRRTWLPALGTAAVAALVGWLVQFLDPTALSIGDLWR